MDVRKYEELQKQELERIQTSRPVAIAKANLENGGVAIVAVFEMAKENKFFFRYTAKTLRTPRRLWKFAGAFILNDGRETVKGELKTPTLKHYLGRVFGTSGKWRIRYPYGKKGLIVTIDRVANGWKQDAQNRAAPAESYGYATARQSRRRPTKAEYNQFIRLWRKGES